jgi:hypothetical protein
MLSERDNERICRVGAKTPMGQALRRYWVPILSSYQLPDRMVIRSGSRSSAKAMSPFGTATGRSASRRAMPTSLRLARSRTGQGGGIRCLFHGWKFAVDGEVLETMTVADPKFRQRFRAQAYPVREAGGMIWAYFGPKELEPPLPHWPYFDYPRNDGCRSPSWCRATTSRCKEALVDSAHLTILHQDAFKRKSDIDFVANVSSVTVAADPKVEVEDTTFGFHYVALRPTPTERACARWRASRATLRRFTCSNANGDFVGMIVPIDDHRTLASLPLVERHQGHRPRAHKSDQCATSVSTRRLCTPTACIPRPGMSRASRAG